MPPLAPWSVRPERWRKPAPDSIVPAGFDEAGPTLYRLWVHGRVAYVGQTTRPLVLRLQDHNRWAWWPWLTSCTAERHPDATTLDEAELHAIRTEFPWFNVRHAVHPIPASAHGPRGQDGLTPEEKIYFHTGWLL